ncbi:MAG: hypothetical protein GX640_11045, partial [Fibrobacter sp.]|nr:hypothetical protein [Fibrobacter sp.]
HFVLPFYSGVGFNHDPIRRYAAALDIPLRIEEEKEEFLEMIMDPEFGYGKNANPCIDCRISRLKKARAIMEEEGASFIATGEVVGQRPMSQRMDCLHKIENKSGLKGILLRPLSAKLLQPTTVELNGLVDRNQLLGIAGRSRQVQLQYAREHKLLHSTPAGGCILTHEAPSKRYTEMVAQSRDITLSDFKLLAYGRHFRIRPALKVVVSRNESENHILERIAGPQDYFMYMADIAGPVAIMKKESTKEDLALGASILVRFSKARGSESVAVKVFHENAEEVVTVSAATEEYCESVRIC